MSEGEGGSAWLATRFEESRDHLRTVAVRMLGSASEAEDAVQEAWVRLSRADVAGVENLAGWLTTVVARICLDTLRSRESKREEPLGRGEEAQSARTDPEAQALVADSIGVALLVVLDMLDPAERTAFVLHDMFDLPFEEIAPIVGRSPAAARQLASRARRRVQGGGASTAPDLARRREVVGAFLAASRDGDLDALLAVLDPDVVLRADELAVRTASANKWGGAPDLAREVCGARAVAETFKGRARGARRALVDGAPGAVWMQGGRTRSAFVFDIRDDKIVGIELFMQPERIAELDVELLDA